MAAQLETLEVFPIHVCSNVQGDANGRIEVTHMIQSKEMHSLYK